ncbi:MAG: hypothetical protein MPJ78_05200 [Hyphomicrobiaceae bacterium]|nr:hypothetical protein [Hyphomicrobiaceae bacterium]
MLRIYFGGLTGDRLGRLGFFAFWLLLAAFFITGGLTIGFSLGIADHLGGGDVQETQSQLRGEFGMPFIVAVWIAGLTFLFAELNISAKRVRHIGLPGWPVTLGVSAVIILAALLVTPRLGHILSLLAWLALTIVPGGVFGPHPSRG